MNDEEVHETSFPISDYRHGRTVLKWYKMSPMHHSVAFEW